MKTLHMLWVLLRRYSDNLSVHYYQPTETGSHHERSEPLGIAAASTVSFASWPDSVKHV